MAAQSISAALRGAAHCWIGQADATAYALARQAAKASNATINRELAVLIRMLRLAYENGKLSACRSSAS